MEYEDFYDEEYEYFDSTIADLKEQLKKEVKKEIQDKITTLEKENEELQDIKKNWNKIKQEYESKVNEIEREKQISLEELSKLSGISKSHLSYIERQEKEPSLTILIKIAKALNIDINDLYEVEW